MTCKCFVRRCDFQHDGYCTTTPEIKDQDFNVRESDEIISELVPVCQSIKLERKQREHIEQRYKEFHEESIKRFGQWHK
jgi:hypothetical protein